jgi:5-methyltetrahydrofolate--homocysteine methyltransferase
VLAPGTLLDGAMGTALLARGLPAGAYPEEWLLARPDEIARVHAEHAAAGARVLLTCTFGCASPALEARVAPAAVPALCAAAAGLARAASRPGGIVAGAVGPSGLAAPGLPAAPQAALAARWEPPLAALAGAGVDLLWIESQWDLGEALAALSVARATGLPAVVTFTPAERGGALVLAGGAPIEEALLATEADGAAAVGVNCVFAGPALAALAAFAAGRLRVPFAAKPSPGLPGAVLPPAAFAAALRPALAAGLRVAGGCCGATADHLRALGPLLVAGS